uniref:Uncharacterized protein n=1 Tax=Lepeophtheirus salmonis TaxID=72036 RepID=A0A0K2VHK0_LEPSM
MFGRRTDTLKLVTVNNKVRSLGVLLFLKKHEISVCQKNEEKITVLKC